MDPSNGVFGHAGPHIVWAIVVLVFMVIFYTKLRSLLGRIEQIEVRYKGIKVAIKSAALTAASLGAADAAQGDGKVDPERIATTVTRAAETGTLAQLQGKRVLWVDDMPENNRYGITSLESQGVEVVTSLSTRDALRQVASNHFDAIITDQARKEDGTTNDRAGYALIRELRENGVTTRVILSTAFPNEAEARSLGFFGATSTQHGVFELVLKAVQEETPVRI